MNAMLGWLAIIQEDGKPLPDEHPDAASRSSIGTRAHRPS